MNTSIPLRAGLYALLACLGARSHAQSLDWGDWSSPGIGTYENGESILIRAVDNASVVPASGETTSAHAVSGALPFGTAPGAGEYGFFHNAAATSTTWSVEIDLSGFSIGADTVIGFSNLDGRDFSDLSPSYAVLDFYDSSGNKVALSPASFLGSYDVTWQGYTWDANSSFDPLTGVWSVAADSGAAHPAGSYFAAVSDAFFLSNLPSDVSRIVYTNYGGTAYAYDSTLFYAGQAVPEPSAPLLGLAACAGFALRRRRSR